MRKDNKHEFIEDLILKYLPFIENIIKQYTKNEKIISSILKKVIYRLIDCAVYLQKINMDFCSTFILYTTKGITQKNLNQIYSKSKIQNEQAKFITEKELEESYGILSAFSEYERDLIIYKDFVKFSNSEISAIMDIPIKEIKKKLSELEKKLDRMVREGIMNEKST